MKFLLIVKIALLFILNNSYAESSKVNEPSRIDFKQLANDYENITLANELLTLIKQLRSDDDIKINLVHLNKKLDKTPLFQSFKPLIDNLIKISLINNFDNYKTNCNDILENKITTKDPDFDEALVFRCNKKFLKLLTQNPKLLTSNKEFSESLNKQIPNLLDYKDSKYFIHFLKSIINHTTFTYILNAIINIAPKITFGSDFINFLQKNKKFKNTIFSDKKMSVNYNSELSTTLKGFVKEIDDLKHNQDYIKYKTNEFLNFIKSNNQNLDKQKTWSSLISYAKSLLLRKHYAISRQVYEVAFDYVSDFRYTKNQEDAEKYFSNIFQIGWTYLSQRDFNGAYNYFEKIGFYDSFKSIPSKIKFWMAYSAEQINKKSLSQKIYQNIIDTNPLHFYAIMSQKKLNFEKKESNLFIKDIKDVNNSWPDISPTAQNHEKMYTESFSRELAELHIWTKLQATYLINKKIDHIIKKEETNVYLKNDLTEQALSGENIRNFLILRVANVLFENSYFLGTFKILYDALNTEKIKVDKKLLSVLFPFEYYENIKTMKTDIDPVVILSLVRQESAFNPKAISPVGALGLMQLMPTTAKTISRKLSNKKLLFVPDNNLKTGIEYFKKLYKRYDGNLVYTLSAYNAGEKNLTRWINDIFDTSDILFTIESIPFEETKTYVQLIIRNIYFYKLLLNTTPESNEIGKIFDVDLTVASQEKMMN